MDARGRTLIERRNVPVDFGSFRTDAYHFLRTATWTRITLLFGGLFLVVNLLFALVLYFGHASVLNAHGFADDYWFSVQTVATIGYGYLAPNDTFANAVVTVESFVGIALSAMITGIVFARFSTPSAKVIFAHKAIIGMHDGKRTLMLRMANARATAIVEAACKLYLSRDERLADGETMRRIHDLPLRRATSPIFALSWLATHTIDESSPLYGITAEHMVASNMNILLTFQGTDDRLAATVHTRYAYNAEDIAFDCRYADLFQVDPVTGVRFLDFDKFHDLEPALTPAATTVSLTSVGEPAGPG